MVSPASHTVLPCFAIQNKLRAESRSVTAKRCGRKGAHVPLTQVFGRRIEGFSFLRARQCGRTLPSRMSCALKAETLQPSAVAAWMQRLLFCSASLGGSSLPVSGGRLRARSSMVSGMQEFSSLLQSKHSLQRFQRRLNIAQ